MTYAGQRMTEEFGAFSDYGYIAYKGFISLEELMAGNQSERIDFQMGGKSHDHPASNPRR